MAKYKGLAVADRQNHGKRARIQNWLIQEGWQIRELQHVQAAWLIQATDNTGRPIFIAQPNQPNDRVDIEAAIKVESPHCEALEALENQERQDFLYGVRSESLRLGVIYGEVCEQQDLPQQIVLSQRIYDDGLRKDEFMQRVQQVIRAMTLVQLAFGRKFIDPPPPQNKVGFYVN